MSPKLRKYMILAHLWAAGFMAPAFGLHAVSGGFYLIGIKGDVTKSQLALPAGASLDFDSPTLETEVRDLLVEAKIDEDFEYIRNRGTLIQTRPTSRDYVEFAQTPEGLTATRVDPDAVKSMMELHFGHGPQLFKSYQKLVAILLILVIFGGVLVGLMAKPFRNQTITAVVLGTLTFVVLAFVV